MIITNCFRGFYRTYPNLVKVNRRMSTCNRLDLGTLGFQPIMPKNLPITAQDEKGSQLCYVITCTFLSYTSRPWEYHCRSHKLVYGMWVLFDSFFMVFNFYRLDYTWNFVLNCQIYYKASTTTWLKIGLPLILGMVIKSACLLIS